jgi:hypothetical protein
MFTSHEQKLFLEMCSFQTAFLYYRFVFWCEGTVWCKVSSYGIFGGQSGRGGTGFSPISSVVTSHMYIASSILGTVIYCINILHCINVCRDTELMSGKLIC